MPTFLIGLGNFLSGMETVAPDARLRSRPALGNFLSGMETFASRRPAGVGFGSLGNFLSGMETHFQSLHEVFVSIPWKLP